MIFWKHCPFSEHDVLKQGSSCEQDISLYLATAPQLASSRETEGILQISSFLEICSVR
jgi:hypothetical protein